MLSKNKVIVYSSNFFTLKVMHSTFLKNSEKSPKESPKVPTGARSQNDYINT